MKINILIIGLALMASSMYAHSDSCPEAGLSDAQQDQWKGLRQDFRASVQELEGEEKQAAWADFQQTILNEVAETDDQKEALEQCFEKRTERRHGRRHKCFEEAGFSAEQKDQWKGLREEFEASVEGLSKAEKQAKKAEFHQHALDIVPTTPDQRTALEQCFEKRTERRKRRGEKHE